MFKSLTTILFALLLCSCSSIWNQDESNKGTVTVNQTRSENSSTTEHFRNNKKILETVIGQNRKNGLISQTVIINGTPLLKIVTYKNKQLCHTFPSDEYTAEIASENGKLTAVTVLKGSKYVEMFKIEKGLLIPVSGPELEKAKETAEIMDKTLKHLSTKSKETQ